MPKVDHRQGIQCLYFSRAYSVTGAFSHFPQATHSIPQPAAWSCDMDGEAHEASSQHCHLTSDWSILKGLW